MRKRDTYTIDYHMGPNEISVFTRERWKDVEKKAWLILLGRGPGGHLGAGNVNTGPEGFKTVASDLADKKYPEVCSQTIDSKMTGRAEEPRLLKNRCVESQEEKEGDCVGVTLEGGAKSNYPDWNSAFAVDLRLLLNPWRPATVAEACLK